MRECLLSKIGGVAGTQNVAEILISRSQFVLEITDGDVDMWNCHNETH